MNKMIWIIGIAFVVLVVLSVKASATTDTNITITSCDVDNVASSPCLSALSADGGTSYALAKASHIDGAFTTINNVDSVNSATFYYDSWGSLTGTWQIGVYDARDGSAICQINPAPEDGSETRNNLNCGSITGTQLANGVWLYVMNNDDFAPESINLDYVFLNVNYEESAGDTTPPTYSNLLESADPITYGDTLQLNSTWTDSESSVSLVYFRSNYTGSWVNYSASNISSEYYYNFGASAVKAGILYYNWIANDTSNNWNTTMPIQTVTINKANGLVYTYLNNTRNNITIQNGTSIWLNGTLETGIGNIELYNNGTLINSGSSPLFNLTLFNNTGLYNITTFYYGNENYTSDLETWFVNATEEIPPPELTDFNMSILKTGLNFILLQWT